MKKALKLIAMLLVIAAVVFAAGCTEEAEPEEEVTENITDENATEANETVETGQVVTEADNGTSISLKNGENFTLQLRENPSTGYSWQLNLSEGLNLLDDYYTQDLVPENTEGEAPEGVPGNHTWIIQAVAPGSQQVNGEYIRPWEEGSEGNFTLTVEVV